MDMKPQIEKRDKAFTVVCHTPYGKQYWNGRRQDWIPASDIHGGSANNPKASYYKTYEAALRAMNTAGEFNA
jgi:hypothetical protein